MKINPIFLLLTSAIAAQVAASPLLYSDQGQPNQLSIVNQTGSLHQWSDNIQADYHANVAGFGNQRWFVANQNRRNTENLSIQWVKADDLTVEAETLASTTNSKGQLVACQQYEQEKITTYRFKLSNNRLAVFDGQNLQKLADMPFKGKKLHHAMCGNVNADMTPEVLILAERNNGLALHVFKEGHWQADGYSVQIPLDAKVYGDYKMVAKVDYHSLNALQIWQNPTPDKQAKQPLLVKSLSPYQMVPSFDYQDDDFSTVWVKSTGLTRAGAKLMWNFGAKSIHHLDQYLTSLGKADWSDADKAFDRVLRQVLLMDPGQSFPAAMEVSNRYYYWKTNA